MRALILDASPAGDARTRAAADALTSQLLVQGWHVERMLARDLKVQACAGCFGCWVKTPGECVIDDDARKVTAALVASDLYAIVTPVRFGTYGALAKSLLDRSIGILLPHFTFIKGEVHHGKRYPRYPRFLVVGTSSLGGIDLLEETRLFRELVSRNAINMHSPAHGAVIAGAGDPVEAIILGALDHVCEEVTV